MFEDNKRRENSILFKLDERYKHRLPEMGVSRNLHGDGLSFLFCVEGNWLDGFLFLL